MAGLKCKNCGGNMLMDEKNEYAVCEYCGAKQKIEKSEAEIKAELMRKNEEQIAQQREKANKTNKKIKKAIQIILIIFIVSIVLFVGSAIVAGIIEAFKEDDTVSEATIVSEMQIQEKSAQNQEVSLVIPN